MTRINSTRMVLAIVAVRILEVHQMDVQTTFLNEDLDKEIYMEQPEGFSASGQERKVYKLVKSLHGLKQAPKQWHEIRPPRSRSSESLRKFTKYAPSHTSSPVLSMTLFCNKMSSTLKLFLYLNLNTILDIML